MKEEKEVTRLLREAGATLLRYSKGHPVYAIPGRGIFICPNSGHGNCPRAWKNNLSTLKRILREPLA